MASPDVKRKILDSSSLVSAIRNIVWLLGGASAGIAYVYTKGTSFGVLLTAAVLLLLTAAVAVLVGRRRFRRMRDEMTEQKKAFESLHEEAEILEKTVREFDEMPFGYRMKSVSYAYSFDSADHSLHSHECDTEIEATRGDVNLFEARYTWSGSGTIQLSLDSPRQVLLSHHGMRLRGSNYYYVFLQRPLMLGDTEQILVRQRVVDQNRSMQFQLTKTVREPIDSLALSVTFPVGGPGRQDVWAVSRKSERDDSKFIERCPLAWDERQRRASLKIENPVRGVTYAIEWSWDRYRLEENRAIRVEGSRPGPPESPALKPRRSAEGNERTGREG